MDETTFWMPAFTIGYQAEEHDFHFKFNLRKADFQCVFFLKEMNSQISNVPAIRRTYDIFRSFLPAGFSPVLEDSQQGELIELETDDWYIIIFLGILFFNCFPVQKQPRGVKLSHA